MTSSPPTAYTYLEQTGIIVPDTSSTLAEVSQEWQQTFGADLIVTPDTPQGVMITAEAVARNNVINNNAALANQINPNIAGGVFLDALMALTGISRNVQQPTVVPNVTVTGVAGTIIPIGAQAQTAAGDIFQLTAATTIPSGGSTTANFQSVEYGPIPCAENALNVIVTGVIGWESVTNGTGGTLGSTTQSDQAARAYRLNTLGFQGLSLAAAITSALYAVPGVTSLSFLENYNSTPMGALISVTGGTTLTGTIWGMSTVNGGGTGTNGALLVGTDAINFASSLQVLPAVNPWPVAAYSTTGNIASLGGLGTRSGGDWSTSLSAGQIVLLKNQTTAAQNGIWLAASGAWSRQAYNVNGASILGSNGGISMIRNSIYACVAGGVDTAVAAALLENKSSGCAWTGGTVVPVTEPATGQVYTVLFDTPTQVEILVNVTVHGATEAQVIQAILNYQSGTVSDPAGNASGLAGFQVGADISVFELAAAICIENPGAYVSSLTIAVSSMSPSYSTAAIPIGLNEIGYVQASDINVTVV
jgi:hypothetical protein